MTLRDKLMENFGASEDEEIENDKITFLEDFDTTIKEVTDLFGFDFRNKYNINSMQVFDKKTWTDWENFFKSLNFLTLDIKRLLRERYKNSKTKKK